MDIVERLRTGLPNVLKEREAANEIDALRFENAKLLEEVEATRQANRDCVNHFDALMVDFKACERVVAEKDLAWQRKEEECQRLRMSIAVLEIENERLHHPGHDAELIERCAKIVDAQPHWKTIVRNVLRKKAEEIRLLKDDV